MTKAVLLSMVAVFSLGTGCIVVATQPPEPGTSPTSTPTSTATVAPTSEPTSTATSNPTTAPTTTSAPTTGQSCGSRGMSPCAKSEYCHFALDAQCGATDKPGVCKTTPEMCTREYAPVCGCDNQTYSNACSANAKGVSVSKEGKCP